MAENFSFGYWLKRQRLARDLRQAELAQQLGIAPITLRKIEADERRPSLQLVTRVADLLGLSATERATLLQVAREDLSPEVLPLPDRAPDSAVPDLLHQSGRRAELVLPSGTLTFLFTDIEGSTQRWERQPQAMRTALAHHDALLHAAIERHGGLVVKGTGDGMLAAFELAEDALGAALAAQRALQAADWGALGALPVRMALHTGAGTPHASDYVGPPLNRAARILAAGHGGQILISRTTAELLHDVLPIEIQLRDLGSYRLKDLARPEHLFQVVAADLPASFPPLRTLDVRSHNLPAQATALIGREREVAELSALLSGPDVRLLTLKGPGGIGKTRLALQAATELIDQFPHGVWFVNLAPISDAALVIPAIAQTLDIREAGGRTLAQTLREALRGQRMLLLLDNFEQVIAAAPDIADLLGAAPQLKLLVTSRERLHLAAEHALTVPPLDVPARLVPLRPEQLSQYDAVRLFVERARMVRADFAVTSANAPAVAEICWRLDGLPLAIELAVARLRLFSPEALLARLELRLPLLTGGPRDLPTRQQTLRSAIAWSYALLTDAEQTFFRELGVFAGGWNLAAAAAVARRDELETLELLTALLDKSLVQQLDGTDGGDPRFTLLETIREYALEQADVAGETEALRQAHMAHFLALAELAESGLTSGQRAAWQRSLEIDHENMQAALAWSQRTPDQGATLLLAGALWWFWYFRGYASLGSTWLEAALSQPTPPGMDAARAKALCGAAALADQRGAHEQARWWLEEAVGLCRALGDRRGLAYALLLLGLVEGHQHLERASTAELEEAIDLFSSSADRWGLGLAKQYLGEIFWFRQDLPASRALFEQSVELFDALGDRWGWARALALVAFVVHDQGDYASARLLFEESEAAIRAIGDKFVLAVLLNRLGDVYRCLGDYEQAVARYRQSITAYNELGNIQWTKDPLHNYGFVALLQGDLAQARLCFLQSLQLSFEAGDFEIVAVSLAGLACVAQVNGALERAATLFGAAQAIRPPSALLDPTDLRDWDRSLAVVRTHLEPAAFERASAAGQAMALEEAIAYAQQG